MNQELTKVACIQTNTQGDMQYNMDEVERMVREARKGGATFMVLPENVFYMRGDFAYPADEHTHRMDCHPGLKLCMQLAAELDCWIHIGSIFVHIDDSDKWANRAVLINNRGQIVTTYDKIHLFDATFDNGEEYRESKKFIAGSQSKMALTPFGQMGISICYDLRFPRMYRELALKGANSFVIPAAFAMRTGIAHWHVLQRARAIENGAFVFAAAQCGEHPGGRKTYGHSLIIDPWGTVLAEGDGEKPGVIMAEIDPSQVAKVRQSLPTLKHDCDYFMEEWVI